MKNVPKFEILILLYQLKELNEKKQRIVTNNTQVCNEAIEKLQKDINPLEFLQYRIDRGI